MGRWVWVWNLLRWQIQEPPPYSLIKECLLSSTLQMPNPSKYFDIYIKFVLSALIFLYFSLNFLHPQSHVVIYDNYYFTALGYNEKPTKIIKLFAAPCLKGCPRSCLVNLSLKFWDLDSVCFNPRNQNGGTYNQTQR